MRRIGYTDRAWGIDADTCKVLLSINRQSPDIDAGVRGLAGEASHGGDDPFDRHGAGDQGMMFGFACNETESLMPLPIELAHRLTRQLSVVRREGGADWLRPDGKAQVTVEYAHGRPHRIDTIVVSTQHSEAVGQDEIARAIRTHVIDPVIPTAMIDDHTHIYVNPSGQFITGGPLADAGLTGRKIIVDTYGGMARHGGGAFSGKDPSKVDRSAAYAARHVARNIVARRTRRTGRAAGQLRHRQARADQPRPALIRHRSNVRLRADLAGLPNASTCAPPRSSTTSSSSARSTNRSPPTATLAAPISTCPGNRAITADILREAAGLDD